MEMGPTSVSEKKHYTARQGTINRRDDKNITNHKATQDYSHIPANLVLTRIPNLFIILDS